MGKAIDRVLEGLGKLLGDLGLLPQPEPKLVPIPVRSGDRRRVPPRRR